MSKFAEPAFGLCENVRVFDKVLISLHMLGIALLLFATKIINITIMYCFIFSHYCIRQCNFSLKSLWYITL